ncbi:MAG: YebC/PmpR family DNA-binding transcriptional regulator [Gemmatimonadota bacterium]
MSGHSKWSTIKRKKAAVDAKRGKIFTKLIKEISVAARAGGGDPDANPRLRTAMDNARAQNLPTETMEKAIQRGTGELPGVVYEPVTYEAYGPGGVAIFIEALTDNKNRTVASVRHLLTRHGGNLGSDGVVAWMFDQQGQILVDAGRYDEDAVLLAAAEAGAEDVVTEEGVHRVMTPFTRFQAVLDALQAAGIATLEAELAMVPRTTVPVEGPTAVKLLRLLEALDDDEDVQKVAANFDMDESLLAEAS